MRLLPVFVALVAASTAACTNDLVRPMDDARATTAEEPMPPATTVTYPLAVGAVTAFAGGEQAGYSVTALASDSYRLMWTGDTNATGSASHEFVGSVWTTGRFTKVTPGCADGACALEGQDYLSGVTPVAGGERLDWDTLASVGFDGFDVETDGAPIYLDVTIDGSRQAEHVYLPSGSGHDRSPAVAPFGVVAR